MPEYFFLEKSSVNLLHNFVAVGVLIPRALYEKSHAPTLLCCCASMHPSNPATEMSVLIPHVLPYLRSLLQSFWG